MSAYKIFVVVSSVVPRNSVALAAQVIEFDTKDEALFAIECLRYEQNGNGVYAVPLFRTLEGEV